MCRQLPANQFGATPLEVYAFSNDKEAYEHLTADIFDHLLPQHIILDCKALRWVNPCEQRLPDLVFSEEHITDPKLTVILLLLLDLQFLANHLS